MGFTRALAFSWKLAALAATIFVLSFWTLHQSSPLRISPFTTPKHTEFPEKPLVLYVYADSENARANLEFFVQKGLHDAADFVFVFNGRTNATDLIPFLPNVWIVERENTCFDLGSIGEVLTKNDLWKKYKRFITMNASVRGPFFPMYSPSCWTDVFLGRITDRVKLVGTTMNCQPRPHVQSMLFATDDVGMSILLDPALATSVHSEDFGGGVNDPVGFTPCFETLLKAVHSEIGITQLIRSQGYEVDVLLTAFHAAKTPASYCEENGNPDDILYDGQYFGTTVHPYETVFIKANRDIGPATLSAMTRWHLAREMSSWDTCRR
ncbi:hypothetical protein QBC46DRAFT_397422 [Diplogelasinospora grovesii]|uniref:Uncharacterized protein n=1 Tax=Diplogelasinospora grovesii TaxID=303347 RepID=A0AAN6MYX2_9PEZI|nr:hypothetical protein QBC46DRAFT_397422 [Diplogelasinospora grovesii]